MRIIISPAKRMHEDTDSLPWRDLPQFLNETTQLLEVLRSMDYEGLKKLWRCNDKIAGQNYQQLQGMKLTEGLTPAILAYEGIQYQYMAPGVFTYDEFAYIEEHLRILSGFYGLLRPFDGVRAYRLEMQAKLPVNGHGDLYGFWDSLLAEQLERESDTIVDLASKEYSKAVSRHLPPSVRMIQFVFGQWDKGKIVEKGTLCKMARGEMVRYMAENQIDKPEQLTHFDRLSFHFSQKYSHELRYVYIKE